MRYIFYLMTFGVLKTIFLFNAKQKILLQADRVRDVLLHALLSQTEGEIIYPLYINYMWLDKLDMTNRVQPNVIKSFIQSCTFKMQTYFIFYTLKQQLLWQCTFNVLTLNSSEDNLYATSYMNEGIVCSNKSQIYEIT